MFGKKPPYIDISLNALFAESLTQLARYDLTLVLSIRALATLSACSWLACLVCCAAKAITIATKMNIMNPTSKNMAI